jgi:AcrR family transcriptional regulator
MPGARSTQRRRSRAGAVRGGPRRRDAGRPRGAPIAGAVLTRTLEELSVRGLEGLSVERIARRAEVNKTSVYRRWPTREALVAAALEGVLDGVEARLPDTGSLRGDLLGLLEQVAGLLGRPVGRAVARAAMSEAAGFAAAELAARRLASPPPEGIRALVARARARGEWRPGVDPHLLLSTLVGAVLHRALLERAPLERRWLEALVGLVLGGASPPAPAPPRRR